jgi:hypothetical protein
MTESAPHSPRGSERLERGRIAGNGRKCRRKRSLNGTAAAGRLNRLLSPAWQQDGRRASGRRRGGNQRIMSIQRRIWLVTLACLTIAGIIGGHPAGAARRAKDVEITILTTTSNRGEIEPCG